MKSFFILFDTVYLFIQSFIFPNSVNKTINIFFIKLQGKKFSRKNVQENIHSCISRNNTWDRDPPEPLENQLPYGLQVLVKAGVTLPLLQGFHLQLADSGLHALNMLLQHCILFFKFSCLFTQLTQFILTSLL